MDDHNSLPPTRVEGEASHQWFQRFGLTCCKACGIVKRADGQNKPCPGHVRIGLRTRDSDRFDPALPASASVGGSEL